MGERPNRETGERAGAGGGRLAALGFGTLHGLIVVLAFPGIGLWPLAIVAPLPLVLLVERTARLGRSAVAAGLFAGLGTLPMWLQQHLWVAQMSALGLVPMAVILSVYPALFVWWCARVRRRWPSAPIWLVAGPIWMSVEFLRGSLLFDGYPWLLVGHPLIEWSALSMPARWFGAYTVSLLCVAASAAMVDVFGSHRRRGGAALAGVAGLWALAAVVPAGGGVDQERTLAVGIIQTDVPQSVRGEWPPKSRVDEMVALDGLTRESAARIGERSPSVVVWPETMFPGYFLDPASLDRVRALDESAAGFRDGALAFAEATIRLERDIAPPLLVGLALYDELRFRMEGERIEWEGDARYNSAVLLDGGEIVGRYDKLFLTPFGEVMPYISAWPALERALLDFAAIGMRFDLSEGERPVRFELGGGVRVATPICFEATMPGVCRRLVFEGGQRRAEVLINMTNDGWFGNSDRGRRMHLLGARWRCVELATPMVRAANTGISCLIDASGRVVSALPVRERDHLVVETPTGRGVTMFGRIGHALPWTALGGSILLLALTYFGDRRGRMADAERAGDRPRTKETARD